jgi:putative component of toxin-antitoxin plasmid stabilization module
MNFKIVKLNNLSGECASVYSVFDNESEKTLFEIFIEENKSLFLSELKDISSRLRVIGHKTGAREQFFKHNEGILGDGICALYDDPQKNLRLYCIRYGTTIVILGGGGSKPKSIRKFQESSKLEYENYILRELSAKITDRIRNREIWFSDDYKEILGNLEFNDEE